MIANSGVCLIVGWQTNDNATCEDDAESRNGLYVSGSQFYQTCRTQVSRCWIDGIQVEVCGPAGTLCAPALASEHVSFPMLFRVLWPRRCCEDAQRQRSAGYDREISHVTIDLELAGMMATRAHDTTVMAELSVQGRRNVHDEDEALELGV